jgi:hypothetical protein
MVPIAVGQDDRGYRLGGNFGDVVEQLFTPGGADLGVDYDYTLIAHNYGAVTTAAFHPIYVGLQHVGFERRGRAAAATGRGTNRRLALGERARSDGEHKTSELKFHLIWLLTKLLLQNLHDD